MGVGNIDARYVFDCSSYVKERGRNSPSVSIRHGLRIAGLPPVAISDLPILAHLIECKMNSAVWCRLAFSTSSEVSTTDAPRIVVPFTSTRSVLLPLRHSRSFWPMMSPQATKSRLLLPPRSLSCYFDVVQKIGQVLAYT